MTEIAEWLSPGVAVPWTEAFGAGKEGLAELVRNSREVDGAIFVFAEDDKTESRNKALLTTRDNVWFEYGLFAGSLGRERVQRVTVGKPWCATDLLGITAIQLPSDSDVNTDAGRKETDRAKGEIQRWVRNLPPIFFEKLPFKLIGREPIQVKDLLIHKASDFLKNDRLTQIRALCSDKGVHSRDYYNKQFAWVRKEPRKRRLRRVFIKKSKGGGLGFSTRELEGIQMHLEAQAHCAAIEIRWIHENNPALGAIYKDSLGFALFDEMWFLHWGLKSGFCCINEDDKEIGKQFAQRFEYFWQRAIAFEEALVGDIQNALSQRTQNAARSSERE